jgi:hypothetical protein
MAICRICDGEMLEGISCRDDPIRIGDRFYEPIRWGDERKTGRWVRPDHCRDCSTPLGGVHHHGCCIESCAGCHGQAMGCPCFDDYGDDYEDKGPEIERTCRRGRRKGWCRAHLFRPYRS